MDQPDPTATETTEPDDTGDTGDIIDVTAADPPPGEVTDPEDPSYVEPAPAAVRVHPRHFTDDSTGGDSLSGEETVRLP